MNWRVFHKFGVVVIAHRNDDMFLWQSFHSHLNVGLYLWSTFNNIIDLIYLFGTNRWEHFFDFDDFGYANVLFWNMGVRLWRLSISISWFVALEEFWDQVDLFLRFSRNRRWNFFYACWGVFVNHFVVFSCCGLSFQGELGHNFPSERGRVIVSIKYIPVSFINRGNEISNCFTNTVKIFQIICLRGVYLFVHNVLSHEV